MIPPLCPQAVMLFFYVVFCARSGTRNVIVVAPDELCALDFVQARAFGFF